MRRFICSYGSLLIMLLLVGGLVLTACGGKATPTAAPTPPPTPTPHLTPRSAS